MEQIEVADSTCSLQLLGEGGVEFFVFASLHLVDVHRLAVVAFYWLQWAVLVGARKVAIRVSAAVCSHMVRMVSGYYWLNALSRELLCHQYSPNHTNYFDLSH